MSDVPRPKDLALLLLASGELLPRQRARDQQADRAGLDLKRQVLDRLVALDPDPAEVEAALLQIVDELGPPSGPTRAIALSILEDWKDACTAPEWMALLLGESVREGEEDRRSGRKPVR